MIRPSLEQARTLAEGHTVLPIALEIFSDIRTPIEVLKQLKAHGHNPFILESVENGQTWGRYTFLGHNPSAVITGGRGDVAVKTSAGVEVIQGDSLEALRQIVRRYHSPRIPGFPPFTGGFVGYFAFDYVDSGEFTVMLYSQIIAFDHLTQKIFLITNIDTADLEQNYINGVAVLKDMEALVTGERAGTMPSGQLASPLVPSCSEEEFARSVEGIQAQIREKKVSQVVPSITFTADYEGDLLGAYRALRTINPSSYMFYLQLPSVQVAGASPETLVSVKNGLVSTYPLAGTCPRTDDDDLNTRRLAELLSDDKELGEHEMLVDGGKEDLAKVCDLDSITVDEYRVIKTCSHVYHIESKITGRMRPGLDALDAIGAALPAGTLSGAPKERAMEIIAEVEKTRREIYGGALGYIDFAGDMDLCIAIRMAVLKDGQVSVQAGAGIVEESVATKEYHECCNKAKAMLEALAQTGKN